MRHPRNPIHHRTLFATATRYALTEHLRNRFAMVLVAAFIPVWTALAFLSVPSTRIRFRLRATGEILSGSSSAAFSGGRPGVV